MAGRWVLRIAALACLVAGLWPDYVRAPASPPVGASTDLRLGLPFSPLYRYHRESIDSAESVTMFGDGARIEASSISGYRSEWHIRFFSWSAALVLAGTVLIVVSLRSGRFR
jgi:hypothetical protein